MPHQPQGHIRERLITQEQKYDLTFSSAEKQMSEKGNTVNLKGHVSVGKI